jgi:hypothetical protein
MAGQAASTAYSAAAAASTDAGQASNASRAAQAARDIAVGAQLAADAAAAAGDAARNAGEAAQSASNAGNNAAAAAQAAVDAGNFAASAGADATIARNAAATARTMADRATRASNSAKAFATVAANAADQARAAATRAAQDAIAAAAAADDAAAHAGNSANAAAESTKHANAATTAAQASLTAATQARQVFDAARTADSERLAIQADQANEVANNVKAASTTVQTPQDWDADQVSTRDAETNALLVAATATGASPALVVSNGRKIAMRLADARSPWTKEAATAALAGSDAEVREYVRNGIGKAVGQDDRVTLRAVADRGSQALRNAANTALAGSDADVVRFLRDRTFPGRDTEDRIKVNNVLADARTRNRTATAQAAQTALDAGTGTAYREFLTKRQFTTAATDDRIQVNQLVAATTSGPETKAMAQASLAGTPTTIRQYLQTGRFVSARRDADAAAHISEVSGFLAKASSAASNALKNSYDAQSVAATARGAASEAAGYAQQARDSASEATGYAQQARDSSQAAERSAQQAADSARTAQIAAESARTSSREATRSAVWAQASATQAAGFAQDAVNSARAAYNSAITAGLDAALAIEAANKAYTAATTKIGDAIVEAANRQAIYCQGEPTPEAVNDCVHMITATPDEKTARAYENGEFCAYHFAQGSPSFQNCTADVLSSHFKLNRELEVTASLVAQLNGLIMAGLMVEAAGIAVVGMVACAASVVCGGILLSLAPEGMAFYPAWVTGVYAGAAATATSVRVLASLEGLNIEASVVEAAIARQLAATAGLSESERVHALGWDFAKKMFLADELAIAIELERMFGIKLVRWPFPKGPDWIDPSTGALYDTIGFEASFFDSEWQLGRLQNSIMKHLKKAHFVPIDVSDLRPDQLAKVRAFIEPYAPKVFLVGVK